MASTKGVLMATPPTTYGHDLLLDTLIAFLTTDPTLVAQNQQWEVLADNHAAIDQDRYVYLKARGMGGADAIYVNIKRFTILTGVQPVYNWEIRGAQGYSPTAAFEVQPGSSMGHGFILYDEDIPYWIFANGQRFVINARVLSYHSNVYCGLYLPYSTSAEFPYPMAILCGSDTIIKSYLSAAGNDLSGFFNPKTVQQLNTPKYVAPGSILRPDGVWTGVVNMTPSYYDYRTAGTWPYAYFDGYNVFNTFNIRDCIDGSIPLFPIVVFQTDNVFRDSGSMYGELDGVYAIPGGPHTEKEDTLQIGADTYITIGDGEDFSLTAMAAVKEG